MSSFYRFSWHANLGDREAAQPHKARDGDACLELAPVLLRRHEYGGPLFNPPDVGPDFELSVAINSGDLLVLTTRPPLDDRHFADRRWIRQSFSSLERDVFAALRPIFRLSTGSTITLSDEVARHLGHLSWMASIESYVVFRRGELRNTIHKWRAGRRWERWSDDYRAAAAYLVYLEGEAWPGGPGILCSFSQGGTHTLMWNHLLRRDGILERILAAGSSLVVALLEVGTIPPKFLDLALPGTWRIRDQVTVPLVRTEGGWGPGE